MSDGARVARIGECDWREFASLRLRALADTLGCDDPQYRRESTFTAAQWRRRLRAHAQFGVRDAGRFVGLVSAQRESAETVYLYSLWVEPAQRGHELAADLLGAAVDWARDQSADRVTLRVDSANTAARSVYERVGFGLAGTGGSGASTEPGARSELTMMLPVQQLRRSATGTGR